MSTTQNSAEAQEVITYLRQQIKDGFSSALGAMLGQSTPSTEDGGEQVSIETGYWFEQAFDPAGTGTIWYGLDHEGALQAGHKLLIASGLEGESDDTAIETLGEVIAQLSGGLASSFTGRRRREVVAKALKAKSSPSSVTNQITFQLRTEEGVTVVFTASVDAGLMTALVPPPQEVALQTAAGAGQGGGTSAPSPSTSSIPINTRNLELLLDVELPVSVSFGKAQLQLKEVIKLTTGSIVELNRAVSEPVDIIVNNCVIAHGEVVVVEGNFGVRIKQIISKQDRLRSLS